MKSNNDAVDIKKCCLYEKCAFLIRSQNEMPELAEKLTNSYCLKNHRACARKVIAEALGPDAVPDQMMPHQNLWAEQILADAGKGSFIYNNGRKRGRENNSQ